MSLIIEALEKLKNKEKGTQKQKVPPKIVPSEKKGFSRKFYLLLGVLLFVLLMTTAFLGYAYFQLYYTEPQSTLAISKEKNKESKVKTVLAKKEEKEQIKEEKPPEENINQQKVKKEKPQPPQNPPIKPPKVVEAKKESVNKPAVDTSKLEDIPVGKLTLAEYFEKQGETLKAIKIYEEVLTKFKDEDIAFHLVKLYIKAGKPFRIWKYPYVFEDQSKAKLVALLLIRSSYTDYAKKFVKDFVKDQSSRLFLTGVIYEKEGFLDKALTFYSKAYNLNKNDAFVIYSYGRALEITGNYELALKVYKSFTGSYDTKVGRLIKDRIKLLEGSSK